MKKQSGITLIALIITIIVLSILAGVTIGAFSNRNIFEKAKVAKEKYEQEPKKEQKALERYIQLMNGNGTNEKLPENAIDTEAGTIVQTPENPPARADIMPVSIVSL